RLPISTIHNRIRKMEVSGAVKGYTIVLDDKKTGMIMAYLLVTVNYHPPDGTIINQHELAKKIKQIPCVTEVSMTTGSCDIIVKVQSKNMEELNDFVTNQLRSFKGVDKTQTLVVLNSI
ncbi:MAG TPA: Lrp/AsnC family transcriptional regulator, partial [Candidatus Nanoarchaeia archaeon]|nr:Lrp/AsnC family transcriptional regulator [Candidatus Nanoarchaeia archaeon]